MQAPGTPLVATEHLRKDYPETRALDDLSFTLSRGEILGFLGPNGAGKTTAIHILLGLLEPTGGRVSVFGLSPLMDRVKIASRLNFSSAYVQLPSNLKVCENLRVFAKLYNVRNARAKISELMEIFEIAHLSNRLAGALSAGERTRLNLCKCLLNDPELLLLDEPTASLDPEMADTVRKRLVEIRDRRKIGILYTSHNMREVEEICDRVLFLNEGKTIAQGTPKEVLRNFGSTTLEQVFIQIVRSGDLISAKPK